jgi:hypothetical protein
VPRQVEKLLVGVGVLHDHLGLSMHRQHLGEMLSDRFGALEAVAYSSIKLARHMAEPELSMDLLVASAVLEFADDLRAAMGAVDASGQEQPT